MDYIKGLIFIVLFIYLLNSFGHTISKSNSFSKNVIVGYVCYSCLQAVGGFFTQYFKIDFAFYNIYMIILIILMIFISFYKKEWKLSQQKEVLITHMKKYYLLYTISLALVLLAILNVPYLWLGNHQDDGWYLLKVALAPFLEGGYDVSYATGFQENLAFSRTINTFELDYAFWSNLLSIYPTIFCKVFMNYLNYFITLVGFYTILDSFRQSEDGRGVNIFLLLSIMIFAINPETFANHNILAQQDGWHFNTAMWYGSGLVRCAGLAIMVVPFLKDSKLTRRSIFWFAIASVALMSKASQGLPIIFISVVAMIIYEVFNLARNRQRAYYIAIIMLVIMLVLVPMADQSLLLASSASMDAFFENFFIIPSLIIIFIAPIVLHNEKIFKWSYLLFIITFLMICPRINSLFLHLSVIDFVVARTYTMLTFYIVITAGIYLGLITYKILRKERLINFIYVGFSVCCIVVYGISLYSNAGVSKSLTTLKDNPALIPKSTIELSKSLQEVSEQVESQLYAIVPSWVNVNGFSHGLGTTLKIEAKDVYSISAIHRYMNMTEESPFKDFAVNEQNVFEAFYDQPSSIKNQTEMKALLDKYPIDTIVVVDEEASQVLEEKFEYHQIKLSDAGDKCYYILLNSKLFERYNGNE